MSILIFNHGGGAKELAVKVQGGTTQPTGAAGMLWINTATAINKWTIAAAQPSSPTNGDAWIQTDASNANVISLLKKDSTAVKINVAYVRQWDGTKWGYLSAYYYNGVSWAQISWASITDTFARSNATTLGYAETGEQWQTVLGSYALGITNNTAYGVTAGQQPYAVVEASSNNVDISVTISTYADYCGILFRYSDANNYWVLGNSNNSSLYFSGKSGGTAFGGTTGVWVATGLTIANGAVIRVVCNGTSIRAYLNGTLVIDITKSEAQNGTKHGISVYSNTGRLDNFILTRL